MKYFYLLTFLAGLALAVHSMLHGMESWRRKKSGKQSPVLNPPAVAALLAGFGACGYLVTTRTALGIAATLGASTLTGAVTLTGMIFLMARWALRDNGSAATLEEEDIHGQVAVVSRIISPDEPGEISYYAWDAQHTLAAQSVDGSAISEGTEVVIEAVENGIARVELWSVVEQRL